MAVEGSSIYGRLAGETMIDHLVESKLLLMIIN